MLLYRQVERVHLDRWTAVFCRRDVDGVFCGAAWPPRFFLWFLGVAERGTPVVKCMMYLCLCSFRARAVGVRVRFVFPMLLLLLHLALF